MPSCVSHLKIEERFALQLSRSLCAQYGKLPSAAFVANQLNLRIKKGDKGVSEETVRRWMRGVSMPTFANLEVLVTWLNLQCFCCVEKQNLSHNTKQLTKPQTLATHTTSDQQTIRLIEIFNKLSPETKSMLVDLVSSLHH